MTGFDWFLVAWWVANIFISAAIVGKPRKPFEPLAAAFACLISLGMIAGLLISRGVFS